MSFELMMQSHDVWLFRDGKPFRAGEDTRARSFFPPTPFTIQGAIRARVLFSSAVNPADYASSSPSPTAQRLRQLIGAPGHDYGKLRLKGPLLAKKLNGNWKLFFPLPADVVKCEGRGYAVLSPLQANALSLQSNAPDDLVALWLRTPERVEDQSGWIWEDDLERYLQGQAPQKVYEESEFVVREHRFGIALEAGKRTTREGHLYLAEFLRLKEDVALWAWVDGIQKQDLGADQGVLQLGGEARVAYYATQETVQRKWMPASEQSLPERFKVVLLTPAWFAEGWRPRDWSNFFQGNVRFVAAAIPRYQSIGGAYVDDQRRRGAFQKPMRRFVPAGAVYYFKGQAHWTGQPFTETPVGEGHFGAIGFGCFAIGTWDYA